MSAAADGGRMQERVERARAAGSPRAAARAAAQRAAIAGLEMNGAAEVVCTPRGAAAAAAAAAVFEVGAAGASEIERLRDLQSRFDDIRCRCRDCGTSFVFTARQQLELSDRGHKNVNKTRCADCAKYKKNRFSAKGTGQGDG